MSTLGASKKIAVAQIRFGLVAFFKTEIWPTPSHPSAANSWSLQGRSPFNLRAGLEFLSAPKVAFFNPFTLIYINLCTLFLPLFDFHGRKKNFFTLYDLVIQHGFKKFFSITTLKTAVCLSEFLLIVKSALN